MKPGLLFFAALLVRQTLLSQDIVAYPRPGTYERIKSTDLVIGIHWQGNASEKKSIHYGELGIAKAMYVKHYHGTTAGAVYASEEIRFSNAKNIFGTKLGVWFHFLLDFGFAAVYYTDFEKGNFKLRPEIGFGLARLRAVAGYNIPTINNSAFKELQMNNSQFSLQYTVALHKKTIK